MDEMKCLRGGNEEGACEAKSTRPVPRQKEIERGSSLCLGGGEKRPNKCYCLRLKQGERVSLELCALRYLRFLSRPHLYQVLNELLGKYSISTNPKQGFSLIARSLSVGILKDSMFINKHHVPFYFPSNWCQMGHRCLDFCALKSCRSVG